MTSASMRDMYVGIYFRDEATTTLQHLNQVMDNIEDEIVNVGQGLTHTTQGFNHFGHAGISASQNVAHGLNNAETEAGQLNQEVQHVSKTLNGFKSMMRGLAGIVAGVFAVNKVKEFGLSAIESAAGFKALDAQFDQVFEEAPKHAMQGLNDIAKQTGMLPERLQGSFTRIAAFAKTTGVDTADALDLTKRATLAAADSAAFYDRSIEEVIENMQSFLKGNYENDAALGISATEFTRNAAAMEKFGKKFNDLTEFQKQDTLMKMVEDGNRLSKALGQAANESDAYENQLGNMKQAWMNFKGKIGGPLLQPFVDSMQSASQWMENLDTDKLVNKIDQVVSFVGTAKETVMSLVYDTGEVSDLWQNFGLPKGTSDQIASFADTMKTTLVAGIGAASTAFEGFKNGISWMIDNKEVVIATTAGIAGAFATFKVISTVNTLMTAYQASTFASTVATQGFNAALRANPIGMVVTGVGFLIAGGVALYQNWDTVKTKAIQLWQVIDNNPILSFLTGPIGMLIKAGVTIYQNWDTITNNFNRFKNAITNFKLPGWVTSIGSTIGKAAGAVGNFISGSHATGLENVPYDGYVAELHKNEAVLTAQQSNTLRSMGILSSNSDGTPAIDMSAGIRSTNSDNQNTNGLVSSNSSIPNAEGPSLESSVVPGAQGHQINIDMPIHINASTDKINEIARLIKEKVPPIVREVISDIIDTEFQSI
ncbi:hypothetical protein M5J14_23345 [Lysinibacillus sp. OL1_EC]|uniref:hypothetical protein n=1 Tax=unclassified Lysinibacillus TaxID=2636778 RepID=UPI00103E5524|nr:MULTISPECIES: hypothetical protein [unclassified Lysinibacillus]MCM0627419.1 hypothetical protein [Lysinibacillus sp. OL1_EC]TBV84848.1 hypothetical protein EW028_23785 [Lysinibacillus sp. OL1]